VNIAAMSIRNPIAADPAPTWRLPVRAAMLPGVNRFISFDARQLGLAKAAGLEVKLW